MTPLLGCLVRACVLVLFGSTLPAAAPATERLPLKPDKPGVWREATYFNRSTQFSCPDRMPRRPICAIELLIACAIRRHDDDMCARVGLGPPKGESPSPGSPNTWYRYRVEKVRFVTRRDIARDPTRHIEFEDSLRIGDLLVTVHKAVCRWGPCSTRHARKEAYRLRKIEGLWVSLAWDDRYLGTE